MALSRWNPTTPAALHGCLKDPDAIRRLLICRVIDQPHLVILAPPLLPLFSCAFVNTFSDYWHWHHALLNCVAHSFISTTMFTTPTAQELADKIREEGDVCCEPFDRVLVKLGEVIGEIAVRGFLSHIALEHLERASIVLESHRSDFGYSSSAILRFCFARQFIGVIKQLPSNENGNDNATDGNPNFHPAIVVKKEAENGLMVHADEDPDSMASIIANIGTLSRDTFDSVLTVMSKLLHGLNHPNSTETSTTKEKLAPLHIFAKLLEEKCSPELPVRFIRLFSYAMEVLARNNEEEGRLNCQIKEDVALELPIPCIPVPAQTTAKEERDDVLGIHSSLFGLSMNSELKIEDHDETPDTVASNDRTCERCGRELATVAWRVRHSKTCIGLKIPSRHEQVFACPEQTCDRRFSRHRDLRRHFESSHSHIYIVAQQKRKEAQKMKDGALPSQNEEQSKPSSSFAVESEEKGTEDDLRAGALCGGSEFTGCAKCGKSMKNHSMRAIMEHWRDSHPEDFIIRYPYECTFDGCRLRFRTYEGRRKHAYRNHTGKAIAAGEQDGEYSSDDDAPEIIQQKAAPLVPKPSTSCGEATLAMGTTLRKAAPHVPKPSIDRSEATLELGTLFRERRTARKRRLQRVDDDPELMSRPLSARLRGIFQTDLK